MRLSAIIVLLSLLPFLFAEDSRKANFQGLEGNQGDRPNKGNLDSHLNREKSTFTGPERSPSTIPRRSGRDTTILRLLLPALLFLKIKTAVLLFASLFVKTFLAGLLLSKTVTIVIREDRNYPPRLWYPTEDPYVWRSSWSG